MFGRVFHDRVRFQTHLLCHFQRRKKCFKYMQSRCISPRRRPPAPAETRGLKTESFPRFFFSQVYRVDNDDIPYLNNPLRPPSDRSCLLSLYSCYAQTLPHLAHQNNLQRWNMNLFLILKEPLTAFDTRL